MLIPRRFTEGKQGPYDGMEFASRRSEIRNPDGSLVFEADLTSVPQAGSDWQITLAGATQLGTGTIGIEFSTNGTTYVSLGSTSVSTSAIAFSSAAQAGTSDRAFFRLTLSPSVVIDNVGISANFVTVPEPATASLLAAGLLGLVRFGRRRSA